MVAEHLFMGYNMETVLTEWKD
ncbi:protein of unknown function [Candidatus Promineifilum breve]|uniref:Uncharacterized protein n=1 Tax=Candidatus Promineifilum breve TaxID=1806508 RepID=A0A161KD01_9CHLR|nr:protein of unknown function [Candidatus Promineifilum breve]